MDVWELEGIAMEAWESTGEIFPVDVREIAARCGVRVVYWPRRLALRRGDTIWIPAGASEAEQRFATAHELGHWLLDEHGLDARDEDAANYLAAALLMPRCHFAAAVRALSDDIPALAQAFGVTQTAALLRLGEIGAVELSVVRTPFRVYVRGEWEVPVGADLDGRPGVCAVEITDAPRRRAWVA